MHTYRNDFRIELGQLGLRKLDVVFIPCVEEGLRYNRRPNVGLRPMCVPGSASSIVRC
jgi:hypothetical protein